MNANPIFNLLPGFLKRCNRKVTENRCFEERLSASIPHQLRQIFLYSAVAEEHLRNRGNIARLPQDIAQSSHDALWRSMMNLRVNPVNIAGRPLRSIGIALKNVDPVPAFRRV
jgi:hypothetical protein